MKVTDDPQLRVLGILVVLVLALLAWLFGGPSSPDGAKLYRAPQR